MAGKGGAGRRYGGSEVSGGEREREREDGRMKGGEADNAGSPLFEPSRFARLVSNCQAKG